MRNLFKKLTAATLILAIVLSGFSFSFPRKAEAQWATFDAATFGQGFITAANTTASSFATYSLQFKAFVLDTIATTLVKMLIRQITADVVNWINNGFEGSPAFVTNPGSFFLDVADQYTGAFIAQAGGALSQLCSPFSIDIRLALAFKYRPNIPKKYTCTLGTIIANSATAAENATLNGRSINGFMNGDFSQGGWPAFVSLTIEPQNNVYGAYLQADSDLAVQVANVGVAKRDEISNGRGFLSWKNRECVQRVKKNNEAVKQIHAERTSDYSTIVSNVNNGVDINVPVVEGTGNYDNSRLLLESVDSCPIDTPGSLIVDSLSENIAGPLRELQLVDSINEIVNALAAQLVTQVLKGGLRAVSGSGPSDSSSYLNQIRAEANAGTPTQVQTTKNDFLNSVGTYITNTLQFRTNKDESLETFIKVKSGYEGVRACYIGKIEVYPPTLSSANISLAQNKVAQINEIIDKDITPLATKLLDEAKAADARYKTLTNLRDQANAAITLNELNAPSQAFSLMLQSQSLTTPKDIHESQQQLQEVQGKAASMSLDIVRKRQECDIFPATILNYP